MSGGDSSHLSSLLTETIRMLCQNGVVYSENLRIQGLLVVTADSNNVQVIEISDMLPSPEAAQATGVGSSGLCDTEKDMDYKPPVQMAAQDYPVHPAMTQRKTGPTFHAKAGMRRGFHTIKPPVKRRGGFSPGSNLSHQRAAPKKPRVKMEDAVILVDSPDNIANEMIEPKVETGWADATSSYPSMPAFPEAGDMPGYYGTDMQLYNDTQLSQSASGRRRHRDAVSHTVTSSDEQLAQDIKPFHLNYDEEHDNEDGGQSFLPLVGRILQVSICLRG